MSQHYQRSDPTDTRPLHPQIAFILDRLAELVIEVEELPDAPGLRPTFSAAWQGFQLAADLWMHEPDLMRRMYAREGWDVIGSDMSGIRALLRQLEG